jgi:hypothetical protein
VPFDPRLEQANQELARLLQLSAEAALDEAGEDAMRMFELVNSLEANSRELRLRLWPDLRMVSRNLPATDLLIGEPRPRDKRTGN